MIQLANVRIYLLLEPNQGTREKRDYDTKLKAPNLYEKIDTKLNRYVQSHSHYGDMVEL